MQLSAKQYRAVKLATVMILAIVFSQSFIFKNFLIPVGLLLIGSVFLVYMRKQVKEIIIDERDYAVAGKASAIAIQIYCWLAVVGMFILYSLSEQNPLYYLIASTLAFSAAILMLMSASFFWYYDKIKFWNKRFIFSLLLLIFFVAMAIFSIRVFSNQDNLSCENGRLMKIDGIK